MKDLTLNNRFIHAYNFRTPGDTLDFQLKPLDECLTDGLLVLDANVLLLPLATGALALSAIERVYRKLIHEDRLFVPTHALREYLANRPTKIKELIDQLVKKKEKSYSTSSSPLLQKASVYEELTLAEKSMKEETTKVAKILTRAIEEIKNWETNDPVSSLYKDLKLSSRLVSDPLNLDDEGAVKAFLQENDGRSENKVPPGFKDAGKSENDIGDYLIWKTVLSTGINNPGKDLTFVSGEIKTDWVYKSAGQTLHVREELIDEYRRASKGGSFHLIDLATLLQKFQESEQVVDEVRSSEKLAASTNPNPLIEGKTWSEFVAASERAVYTWLAEDCGMENVGPSAFSGIQLEGEIDDAKHLICVRPLRHIEFVIKRVRELKSKIDDAIAEAELFELLPVEGCIIFICEGPTAAGKVADIVREKNVKGFRVFSGYLEHGEFVTS